MQHSMACVTSQDRAASHCAAEATTAVFKLTQPPLAIFLKKEPVPKGERKKPAGLQDSTLLCESLRQGTTGSGPL